MSTGIISEVTGVSSPMVILVGFLDESRTSEVSRTPKGGRDGVLEEDREDSATEITPGRFPDQHLT